MELAEALARSDARAEAIEVLTALSVDRPEHPEAALATEALEALTGGPVELTYEQHVRRAERFHEERRYDEALAELDRAGRPRDRAALRHWIHLRGRALFDERHHYAEAAAVLAESARLGGAHAQEDQFYAARALSRADRDGEAVIAYRRFAREHPSHARAAEALYLAAWLEMRHDVRGAERRMRSFVESAHARQEPGLAREGRWSLALRAFERRQYGRAATLFEQYAASDEQTLVRARGIYWLGRAPARRRRRSAGSAAPSPLSIGRHRRRRSIRPPSRFPLGSRGGQPPTGSRPAPGGPPAD